MTITRFTPPLDYLQAASRASSAEAFRTSRASTTPANLRQEIAALIDQWIQETSEAMLARWMLDHHKSLQSAPMCSTEVARSLIDPAASLFPESQSPIADVVPAPPTLFRLHALRPCCRKRRSLENPKNKGNPPLANPPRCPCSRTAFGILAARFAPPHSNLPH